MNENEIKLPEVLGTDENGNEVKLCDFKGKRLVLYFYPKDMTAGCTSEACNLRDHYEELKQAGYEVIGVSIDSAESHKKFIAKNALPFHLLADTEKQLVENVGVWQEKSMYGRKYMGTVRTTLIVGPDGNVERVLSGKQIKVKAHAEQILG